MRLYAKSKKGVQSNATPFIYVQKTTKTMSKNDEKQIIQIATLLGAIIGAVIQIIIKMSNQ